VVFFDSPMLSDPPLGATAAGAAAEPVWVATDPDRACETRRRGARWRLRAGLFASPVSAFAGLFASLRGCLLAIVFVLWIRIALRDACTTTSPALGARRAATQEGPSTLDSNASYAGEVERKVSRDNDSLATLPAFKTPQLVVGQSAVSTPVKARLNGAVPRAELFRGDAMDGLPAWASWITTVAVWAQPWSEAVRRAAGQFRRREREGDVARTWQIRAVHEYAR
jgi:hypothetical protein